MSFADLLATFFEAILANPKNSMLAALVAITGYHLRGAAIIGVWLQYAGYGLIILAALLLFGVIGDLNTGVLGAVVELVAGFASGVVG